MAQLHLQQVTGAVAQRRQLASVRELRAVKVAERVVLVLKLPAVVLLAYQLARRVAGEDEYGIPFRLALFQQRAAPFGAGGAAFSRAAGLNGGKIKENQSYKTKKILTQEILINQLSKFYIFTA
ncbi:hypothetical protein ACU9CR_004442 [Cronobacter dublinensis]